MNEKGSFIGFLLILLGAIGGLLLAINALSYIFLDQLFALYYVLASATLFALAFRIRRPRTLKQASWQGLFVSILSIAMDIIWLSKISIMPLIPFILSLLGSLAGLIREYWSGED